MCEKGCIRLNQEKVIGLQSPKDVNVAVDDIGVNEESLDNKVSQVNLRKGDTVPQGDDYWVKDEESDRNIELVVPEECPLVGMLIHGWHIW